MLRIITWVIINKKKKQNKNKNKNKNLLQAKIKIVVKINSLKLWMEQFLEWIKKIKIVRLPILNTQLIQTQSQKKAQAANLI